MSDCDIDLEAWESSLAKIEAWSPEKLFVTHFGPARDVGAHLAQFRERLAEWAETVREGLASNDNDDTCVEHFTAAVRRQLTDGVPADEVALYQQGGAPEMSWRGLARYWTKKAEADS